MNPYGFLIPRLEGDEIEERFDYYLDLVRKGVVGFIVFGGEVESLRKGIRRLQEYAEHPLIISSDLEVGLGQQVRGGTLFPPSMGIASALNNLKDEERDYYLKRLYSSIASEALYAGINTILAPVLDINSNPKNPIIATRAFGEDPETVSYYGTLVISSYKEYGIMSCGKHFPGHGDTDRDSHQELPIINKDLKELEESELIPFKRAIDVGVDFIMLGHLNVPCLEPSMKPATLSAKVVSYLRNSMGFKGPIITDAMNMKALSGYTEEEASLLALKAGLNFILHPSDPDKVAEYIRPRLPNLKSHKPQLIRPVRSEKPDFRSHRLFSRELFYRAIRAEGLLKTIKNPFMILLTDEPLERCKCFVEWFRTNYGANNLIIPEDHQVPFQKVRDGAALIISVFSDVRAWKVNKYNYFKELFNKSYKKVDLFISFGNPYILKGVNPPVVFAYSTSEEAQRAMIQYITDKRLFL